MQIDLLNGPLARQTLRAAPLRPTLRLKFPCSFSGLQGAAVTRKKDGRRAEKPCIRGPTSPPLPAPGYGTAPPHSVSVQPEVDPKGASKVEVASDRKAAKCRLRPGLTRGFNELSFLPPTCEAAREKGGRFFLTFGAGRRRSPVPTRGSPSGLRSKLSENWIDEHG